MQLTSICVWRHAATAKVRDVLPARVRTVLSRQNWSWHWHQTPGVWSTAVGACDWLVLLIQGSDWLALTA